MLSTHRGAASCRGAEFFPDTLRCSFVAMNPDAKFSSCRARLSVVAGAPTRSSVALRVRFALAAFMRVHVMNRADPEDRNAKLRCDYFDYG